MSVSNGQNADEVTFNTSFISREVDSDTVGVVGLKNPGSGADVNNPQQDINDIFDVVGISGENDPTAKDYSSNNVVADGDNRKVAIQKLDTKFAGTTGSGGHGHSGVDGDGAKLSAEDLDHINLYFAELQTTTFDGASGNDDDVSSAFAGETPGGDVATPGVVTTAPNNRVEIRTKDNGEQIEDAGGQKVYGRLTESAGVWTLTYYTNEAGVETAHSLTTEDIRIYYKEVFDQETRPTFPADIGDIGSLDLTADIVDASTSSRGVVNVTTQSFSGNKTFTGDVIAQSKLRGDVTDDSTTTGSGAALPAPSKTLLRITNASLLSIDTISGAAASQMFILTNKTGGEVTITNESGGTAADRILTGTGEDLTLAVDASIFLKYDSVSSRWIIVGGSGSGSGSGSGGINYISNSQAKSNTNGYVVGNDGATSTPVDGTGGVGTITWTRNTTTPLRDIADFNLTKPASNVQGDFVSYDFTIARADQAKLFRFTSDLELVSGTYATGDATVWFYDITNSQLIQPSGYSIEYIVGQKKLDMSFQTNSNSTSYRMIIHISSTSASAYTLAFDNISVGPASSVAGEQKAISMRSQLSSFTHTSSGAELKVTGWSTPDWDTAGAFNPTTGEYTCPEFGYYHISATLNYNNNGTGTRFFSIRKDNVVEVYPGGISAGVANGTIGILINGSATVKCNAGEKISIWSFQDSGGNDTMIASGFTHLSIDKVNGPMPGVSGEQVMFRANSTSFSVTNNVQFTLNPSVIDYDTHLGWNNGTGEYTVPITGYYRMSMNVYNGGTLTANSGALEGYIFVDGNAISYVSNSIAASNVDGIGTTTSYKISAGQIVTFRFYHGSPSSKNFAADICLERISSPSPTVGNELVSVIALMNNNQTADPSTPILYNVETEDSHGAFNSSNGVFTAPYPGLYRFTLVTVLTSLSASIYYYKNGVQGLRVGWAESTATNVCAGMVRLRAGDTLDFRPDSSVQFNGTSTDFNHIEINKL